MTADLTDSNQCFLCANYMGDLTCMAFPKGIPEGIILGEINHNEPLPDQDNDIVFEPKTEQE